MIPHGPIRPEAMLAGLLNSPIMLDAAAVSQVLGLSRTNRLPGGYGAIDVAGGSATPPYATLADVAVISIRGVLVQRNAAAWDDGATGYDMIRLQFLLALQDPSVSAILLDIDSPGGVVAGCFDLVDLIYAARGQKPMWAIAAEQALSAAYAITSAADRVIVPRTGGAGSVGIILVHVEISRALSDDGEKVMLLTYGKRKADGTPYAPLSRVARARYQSEVDQLGDLFVETVARNRGLATSAVRDMQAAIYLGPDAVSAGLADVVASPDAGMRDLVLRFGQPR